MNIIRLAGELFLIYIIYKLIFEFIIPVYNTTKKVKKQFGDMQSKMQEHMNTMNQQNTAPTAPVNAPATRSGDYIEYEEVKE